MMNAKQEFVNNVLKQYSGCAIAFAATMPPFGGYGVGISQLGEAGYSPTPFQFKSYEEASEEAAKLNELAGLSDVTATLIVADTMRRSMAKQEAEMGQITVKLHRDEWKAVESVLAEAYLELDRDGECALETIAEALQEETAEAA